MPVFLVLEKGQTAAHQRFIGKAQDRIGQLLLNFCARTAFGHDRLRVGQQVRHADYLENLCIIKMHIQDDLGPCDEFVPLFAIHSKRRVHFDAGTLEGFDDVASALIQRAVEENVDILSFPRFDAA